jgi:hypothetical protein
MQHFYLKFIDLDPNLRDSQSVECVNLDKAIADVVETVREIVADHISHGKRLTLTSVLILDARETPLREVRVGEVVRELIIDCCDSRTGLSHKAYPSIPITGLKITSYYKS